MSGSIDSIFPWEGLEAGRVDWFQAIPRAWPHYQLLTIAVSISMTKSKTIVFEAVPEDTEADLPALAEETRIETHTASLEGTFTWNRLIPADERFYLATSGTIPAETFAMISRLQGWFGNTAHAAESKVTHFTICGTSNPITGGTCSLTTWSRSLAPETYGEITSTTTDGEISADWFPDNYGVAQHWIGQNEYGHKWEWSFTASGGSSSIINLTTTGPGLPYSLPPITDPTFTLHASPPAGTPITLTATGTTTDPEDFTGDDHGSATYSITFTLSPPP